MWKIIGLVASTSLFIGCVDPTSEADVAEWGNENGELMAPADLRESITPPMFRRTIVSADLHDSARRVSQPGNVYQGWWRHPTLDLALSVVGTEARLFQSDEGACELVSTGWLEGETLVAEDGQRALIQLTEGGLWVAGGLNATLLSSDAPTYCQVDNRLRGGLSVAELAARLQVNHD